MTEAQLLPVVWTLASMTVAVLVILFVSPALLARWRANPGGRLLEQVLRLLYFVGLPYIVLLTGSLTTLDLGLTGPGGSLLGWPPATWLHDLSTTLMIGALVLLPVALASRQIARAGQPLHVDPRSLGVVLVDAVYAEIHWAFYRAAPLILLGNVYSAAVIGALLVAVEWLISVIRNGFSPVPEERQHWLLRGLLLLLSVTLFVLTQNLWLLLGAHLVIELTWKVWQHWLVPPPIVSPPPIDSAPDYDRQSQPDRSSL